MLRLHHLGLAALLGVGACGGLGPAQQNDDVHGGTICDPSGAPAAGHVCDPADVKKATICHVPPGNPSNAHTLCVGVEAVPAHLAHGDHLGACAPCSTDGGTTTNPPPPPSQPPPPPSSGSDGGAAPPLPEGTPPPIT